MHHGVSEELFAAAAVLKYYWSSLDLELNGVAARW